MTNKESIQAAHLEAIFDALSSNGTTPCEPSKTPQAATSCTTITAEAIGEAMEWGWMNDWTFYGEVWWNIKTDDTQTTTELVELYLNIKKIKNGNT